LSAPGRTLKGMDWRGVATAFVGDGLAGLVILYLGYRFVDSKLNLRERESRREEVEAEKVANRRGVLKAVLGELYSNTAQREHVASVLDDEGVPFPLFDIALWNVLAQATVFTTLQEETISALIHAYNRMGAANEQCRFLADFDYGSTALLAHTSFAGRMDDPHVAGIHASYKEFVALTREGLAERLADLKPHLESAIDAVEAELGITDVVPAAQRQFVGVHALADMFPLGQPRKIVPIADQDGSDAGR
jgi:hypothetical protein